MSIRADDIVTSIKPNYFGQKSKNIKPNITNCLEESITIKRRDHICDFRENVNDKYTLWENFANDFFSKSNQMLFYTLTQKCFNHISNNLIFNNKNKLPKIRFSSFNKEKVKDLDKKKSFLFEMKSDDQIAIPESSPNNNKKNKHVFNKMRKVSLRQNRFDNHFFNLYIDTTNDINKKKITKSCPPSHSDEYIFWKMLNFKNFQDNILKTIKLNKKSKKMNDFITKSKTDTVKKIDISSSSSLIDQLNSNNSRLTFLLSSSSIHDWKEFEVLKANHNSQTKNHFKNILYSMKNDLTNENSAKDQFEVTFQKRLQFVNQMKQNF